MGLTTNLQNIQLTKERQTHISNYMQRRHSICKHELLHINTDWVKAQQPTTISILGPEDFNQAIFPNTSWRNFS